VAPPKQADKARAWLAPHLEAGETVVAAVEAYTNRGWGFLGLLCLFAVVTIPISLFILLTGRRAKTWGIGLTQQRILAVEQPLLGLRGRRSAQVKSFPLRRLERATLTPGRLMHRQLEIITDQGDKMKFDVARWSRWEPEVAQFEAELGRLMASG
jgi:hypothetical protein